MKQKIIRSFNQGARTYHSAAEVQTYVAQQLATRLSLLSATRILEIGCGTGLLSQHLIASFPHAHLTLTDIAPEMLKTCHERFATIPNIQVNYADGEALSMNQTFDLITSSMTLHWFEDIEKGINNIIKKLSSGGVLVFAMLGEKSLYEWRDMCEQMNILPAQLNFPQIDFLKERFPELTFNTELYQQSYTTAYDFLSSLKKLGATATPIGHIPVSVSQLRRLFQRYNHEILMTYEIIYGCYTKC